MAGTTGHRHARVTDAGICGLLAALWTQGLGLDLSDETYIFTPDGPVPNLAVFLHMVLGFALYGILMLIAAIQALRFARRGQYRRRQAWAPGKILRSGFSLT